MDEALGKLGIDKVDGILLDLGVSSPQLDDGQRGFSYMTDAPLDMRMNGEDTRDARQIVNTWSYAELKRSLDEYGEERFAPRIAAAICRRREQAPIETTLELVDVIKSAMPASALREKQHPAKRSFQAIRIAVNAELERTYRDGYDLEDIRDKALALGMVPVEEVPSRTITVTISQPKPERTLWDDIVWFFGGLFGDGEAASFG